MNPREAKQKSRDDTRESLLMAAREVFAEHGFAGARVDEIARRSGVNKALVNYHFGGKLELFRAVIAHFGTEMAARAEAAVDLADPPDLQLRHYIRAMAEVASEYKDLPRLMIAEAMAGQRLLDEPPPHFPKMLMLIGGILKRGREQGVFVPLNPLYAQLHIISSIAMFQLTAPFRERLTAKLPPGIFSREFFPTGPPSVSLEDFLGFLEDQILRGFRAPEKQSKGDDTKGGGAAP